MYNLLFGGAAGQGIETTAAVLQKLLKNSGYHVLTVRDVMSRVRGGHNFSLIRFGLNPVLSHSNQLDGIIALNEETVELHRKELKEDGFILCDSNLNVNDARAIKIDATAIGKELGNPRVIGSIAVGAVLKLFNETIKDVDDVLAENIKEAYLEVNKKALAAGYDAVDSRYPHLQGENVDRMLLSGNQAVALGAIAAGIRFYCAYPMSPSTSILEYLAAKGDDARHCCGTGRR